MSGFLLRWALYCLLVAIVLAASLAVVWLSFAVIVKFHDSGWFWLAALLTVAAALAANGKAGGG